MDSKTLKYNFKKRDLRIFKILVIVFNYYMDKIKIIYSNQNEPKQKQNKTKQRHERYIY